MKTLILFALVFFVEIYCQNDEFFFIKDFLLREKMPTKVNAFLCWNKVKTVQLLKILYSDHFRVSIWNFNINRLHRTFPEQHELFLIDLSCNGSETILSKADEAKLFAAPYRWLALKDNSSLEFLPSFKIKIDSRFYIIDSNKLEAVYKVGENPLFYSNDAGKWNKNEGFEYYNELIVASNRSNLRGLTLNITTVLLDLDSLNHIWDYRKPHVDPMSKLSFIFSHYLTDMINASRHFLIQRMWGVRNKTTNQFTGMIGSLQSGEAELGGSIALLTEERLAVIDNMTPVRTKVCFIFRAPPLPYVKNIFVLPFATPVWISFFALTIVTSIVLYYITYWEWKNPIYLDQTSRLRANIFDALVLQIGGICQQGSDSEPVSTAGRIALIFSFIALMFLYTSFSANIVALLQTSSNSIRTLEDLLHSKIKIAADDTPYNHFFLAVENEPVRKALYQAKIAPNGEKPHYMPLEDGVARIRREFFAFHVEVGSGYNVIAATFLEHEKCGLREISYLRLSEPWIPIRKNSPYKELLRVSSRKIYERGIHNREYSRLIPKRPTCDDGNASNFVSVGLIDCYFGFLIFGIGIGCAIGLLILEVSAGRYIKRRKKKMAFKLALNS